MTEGKKSLVLFLSNLLIFFSFFGETSPRFILDVPASAAYYGSYDIIKRQLKTEGESDLSIMKTIFAGGMAGIFNWSVAIPADVIKSRLQTGT